MSPDLTDQLHRLAADAPTSPVHVDLASALWFRGRRARRRARLALTSTLVAGTLGVVTVASLLPEGSRDRVAPASDTGLGVPGHLYDVPTWLTERTDEQRGWGGRPRTERDLAIGTGAAAWLAGDGLPVVVDAEDGSYHLLQLPQYQGNNAAADVAAPVISLSPSGESLAYSWASLGRDAERVRGGVRVVDLRTGSITSHRIAPGRGGIGTAVEAIAWSADERWLGFAGHRPTVWNATTLEVSDGERRSGLVLGRIDLTDRARATSWPISLPEAGSLSVTNDGIVRLAGTETTFAINLAGTRANDLVLGSPAPRLASAPMDPARRVAASSAAVRELVVAQGTASTAIPLTLPGDHPREIRPLAWVGRDLLAATWDPTSEQRHFSLIGPDGTVEDVGEIDLGVDRSLTIASDLVSEGGGLLERSSPVWPREPSVFDRRLALGVAGVGTLLLGVVGLVLKRRRRTEEPRPGTTPTTAV